MTVTLTTTAKNWLAINAGANNCFSPAGISYYDADGVSHTGSTGDVINQFYVAHLVGMNTAKIIANTDYNQFKDINGGANLGFDDVNFGYTNDGTTSGISAYCYVSPILTTITVNPTTSSIFIGNAIQFTAVCKDQNNDTMTCPTLIWSSSNTSIATINSSGLVIGVSTGSTNITANASEKTSNISTITVISPPELNTITISPPSMTIGIGDIQQFTATCRDQYSNIMVCPITWNSDDTTIGTIDPYTGIFTAITRGTVTVNATSGTIIGSAIIAVAAAGDLYMSSTPPGAKIFIDYVEQIGMVTPIIIQDLSPGYHTYKLTLTGYAYTTGTFIITTDQITTIQVILLQAPVLSNITINPNTNSISIGNRAYIFATCIDQYGDIMTCPTITWTSSNPLVATVYNQSGQGVITTIAVGTVNIIATSSGVISNISTLVISSPILTKIGIYPSNPTVAMGQTKQFGVVCYDQYDYSMTCPTIIWDTTDHAMGTITSTGLFTANAPSGTVMVMATAGTIVENILVTLYIPTLASIEEIGLRSHFSIYIGDVEHIYFKCIDQYGNRMTCPTITWTNSNPSVATVDQTGVVTGIAAGTTTITAIAAGIPNNLVVTVSAPILLAIVLEPISASINVGSTLQLTTICSYNTGATMTCPVSWSSDNMSVAIVDSSGLVTGVSTGSANIIANINGVMSNISTITVNTPANITATDITATPNNIPCIEGTCTVNVNVTWQNTGGTTGSFVPNISIDTIPVSPAPYASESVSAGSATTHIFVIYGITKAGSPYTICPIPN